MGFLSRCSWIGTTIWMHHMDINKMYRKKPNMNYTRRIHTVLKKSNKQHLTKQQLYSHLPPIWKTTQVRQTRHAGYYMRSKEELMTDILLWTPTHWHISVGQPARTNISSVQTSDVVWRTCQEQWMIGTDRARETVRVICAISITWCWWWWEIKNTWYPCFWRKFTFYKKLEGVYSFVSDTLYVCVCVCVCVCVLGYLESNIAFLETKYK